VRRASILFVLLIAAACSKEHATFRGAPVILISVDTLRSDHLPAYGYRAIRTPHLDALRRDAVLFERAYSHCPMTLPSHVSIFTGLLPTEHGVRNNVGYRFDHAKHTPLAATLRGNGYRTGAAVSSYVLRSETGIADGFETYDDAIPVAAAGAVSEHQRSGYETLKAADAWLGQHANEPLFYFFHIYEPHAPYEPTYDGEIAKADDIVGRLIERLKTLGIYDKALIVFLSDHGEGLWQHGEDQHGILLYREALQVPLLVKLPGSARANTTVARPVQLADVTPTILDLLAITKSDRSLLKDAKPKPIYSETLYPRIHLGWSELRSLIDERWHYIDGPRPELYDLAHDAGEIKDVSTIERRTYAALRQTMATYPSAIESLQVIDPEDAKKLAALGYIGTPKNRTGPLPNPRDEIRHLDEIKMAFGLADQRRYDEAIPVFRRMLQRNPHLSDVWSKLGEILVEAGRYQEAIETYKTAIAQAERFSPDLALGLGFAYLKNEQPRETVQHAQLALSSNPREANELLARAYADLRRFPEAEQCARAAIEAGDRQPTSILLLAEVQRAEGNLQGALQTIDEAERRANDLEVPHLYGIDYLRGDVLARLDRPDEAIVAFRREIERSPQHMQAYANLALVYFITGRGAEGNATLEQLARANPHRGAYELAAKTLETVGDRKAAARWRQKT
jgi:tetratricopeptide (TPR) repeat protein